MGDRFPDSPSPTHESDGNVIPDDEATFLFIGPKIVLEERSAKDAVARLMNLCTRYEMRIQQLEGALKSLLTLPPGERLPVAWMRAVLDHKWRE